MADKEFKRAFDYIRFGQRGDMVTNDANGRAIKRITDRVDTLNPECNCIEDGKFTGTLYGRDAVAWLLEV